jgi:hypothetical protein
MNKTTTISELIEALSKYPSNMVVEIQGLLEQDLEYNDWDNHDYMVLDILMMRRA